MNHQYTATRLRGRTVIMLITAKPTRLECMIYINIYDEISVLLLHISFTKTDSPWFIYGFT